MTRVLPKGWEEKTLGEVCEIVAGQSPESSFYNQEKRGVPFYQGKKEFSSKYINPAITWTNKITKIALANDILMSVRAPVGPVNYATEKCCIGRGLAAIRPKKDLETDFVFYFLQSIEKEIAGHDGTVFNSISRKEIEKISIPVPSLPEQKRIVEKLDKIFAAIDKAKENTTKNLQNAKEVFDSFLDNVFTEKSASWTQKALGDILSKEKYSMKRGPFGSALRKSFFVPQGIRVFEQYNPINNDPHWKRYFISQEKYKELEAFTAQAGDLLVSCSGSLGKIVELPQNTETGIINQALLKIKLEQTLILNSFFIYWFRSPHVQTLIREKTNGVAIPNLIAVKELKKIKVPVPSRSIQEQIVKKLNFLRAKTQELEQIYTKKLADLDELKQSVLQQAFSGKL